MASRKRSKKAQKKDGIARPKHGRNRSNRRKGFLAEKSGKPSPVVLPPRRQKRKRYGGRADR